MILNIEQNTEKKIIKGLFWGFLIFVMSFIRQILLVPFFLNSWGHYKYSLWLAICSTYFLFITFNTGHSQFIRNLVNHEFHLRKNNVSIILSSAVYISLLIFIVQLIFGIILLNDKIVANILNLNILDVDNYSLPLSLFFLIVSYSIFQSTIRVMGSLYSSSGNIHIQFRFEVIYSILEICTLIICLISGFDIFHLSIALFSLITVFIAVYLYILKIKFPEFYPWWKNGSLKIGFQNFKKSIVFTFNYLFEQLNLNGINIVISFTINSILLPAFITIRTIANTLSLGTNIILNTILPDIQKFHAKNEGEKLVSTFSLNWFITGAFVNLGLVIVLPFVQTIYLFWTKHKIPFNLDLFLLMGWSISIINYGVGFTYYIKGINKLKSILIITILKSVALFGFSILFLKTLGLIAVGIATVISEIITSIFIIKYYADKELAKLNCKIPSRIQFLALLTVLMTGITYSLVYFRLVNIYICSCIGLIAQMIIYSQIFINLPGLVKMKFFGNYKILNWIEQSD
jgi:O-antigen/teichoic acid export membrane protein